MNPFLLPTPKTRFAFAFAFAEIGSQNMKRINSVASKPLISKTNYFFPHLFKLHLT
jgi:hypothetical protein